MATKKELEEKITFLENEIMQLRLRQEGNCKPVLDIVYPNVQKFVQWEELRYSLRSLVKNLVNVPFKVWIVGDTPDWVSDQVNFIHVPYSGKTRCIDILHKHQAVIDHPDIGEEYVWMNDDIYLVNPVQYADLCLNVAINNLAQSKGKFNSQTIWGRDVLHTLEVLKKHKLPTWNYAAHIPHRHEKSKVSYLIQQFNMMEDPLEMNILYYNYWFKDFYPYMDTLELNNNQGFCINRPDPNTQNLENQLRVKKYMNNSEAGMSSVTKQYLSKLFPNPSIFEKS